MNQIRSLLDWTPDPSATDHHVQTPSSRTLSLIQNQLDYAPPKLTLHRAADKPTTNVQRSAFQFRFIQLLDLQTNGVLPRDLTSEQQLHLQKLDVQVGTLPIDKQRQFVQAQRVIVPKYLANHAQIPAVPIKRSRSEIIDQQLRKEHSVILRPNTKRRFVTRKDAIERLLPYHLFAQPISSTTECDRFDQFFENEAKRLLNSTERIQQSIERIVLANDPQTLNTTVYDQYLLEKIQLDDLREEVESRKRLKSEPLASPNFRCEPVMTDEAYFDLFQSEG